MTAITSRRTSRTPGRSSTPVTNQISDHANTSRKNTTDGAQPNVSYIPANICCRKLCGSSSSRWKW